MPIVPTEFDTLIRTEVTTHLAIVKAAHLTLN
jgi:hypothetical protein